MRHRVTLKNATVQKLDGVVTLRFRLLVEPLDFFAERRRVLELRGNKLHQTPVFATCQQVVGNAPHLDKLCIETDDTAGAIDDQNSIGGGFERGVHQRKRMRLVFFDALSLRDFRDKLGGARHDPLFQKRVSAVNRGVLRFNLAQHPIEAGDQLPEFILRTRRNANGIIAYSRDLFRRSRQTEDRLGNVALEQRGEPQRDQRGSEQHESEQTRVRLDALPDTAAIGDDVDRPDSRPLALIEKS